jgi:hypothetical protein
MWEPPTVSRTAKLLALITVIQMARLLRWHSHTDGQTPSATVREANSSVEQAPRSERRQHLYTAVCDLDSCTSTQALANQRPQLQLRLQLARTQPSSNGIKCGPPSVSQSVSRSDRSVPPAPASLAAPPSARVRHGSSPTCKGSNSTHRRQSTLPA